MVFLFALLKLLLRLYIFPPHDLLFLFPHVSNRAHHLSLQSLPTSTNFLNHFPVRKQKVLPLSLDPSPGEAPPLDLS